MSLLLDALKRAEQEKLARQARGQEGQGAAEAAPEATPEAAKPQPEATAPTEPATARGFELESHRPASPPAAPKADREGAKAVFAAKQADSLPAEPASGSRKVIIGVAIGAVVLFAAGGGYVWYEINKTPTRLARGPVFTPRPVTPAPGATAPPGTGPTTTVPAGPGAAAVPPVATLKPESLAGVPPRTRPEPRAAEEMVLNLLKDSANARPAPPLKLSRTIEPPRVAPEVSDGYEALKSGDWASARKHYEAAVAADATSIDAHLGLATAAARTGDRETATRHYRRVLALDPKNPSAVAGLASLADFSRPEGLETQLRADITNFPQSSALQYTLGNLYAMQSRWTEAQAAYFEAYRLDPESADLVYNLAVSLDHLGQARLASDFYQRALAASKRQAAQFDKAQVSRRIAELKP